MSKNRVLVVGVARSGTSWMGDTLGSLPGTAYVREPDTPGSEPLAFIGRRGLQWMPTVPEGGRAPGYEQLWDVAFAGGWPAWRVVKLIRRRQNYLPGPAARYALSPVAALARRRKAAACVVVKSVFSLFSLAWLTQRYSPSILVVHRHPLNVVASWRNMGWGGDNVIGRTRLSSRLAALDIPLEEVAGRFPDDAVAICGLMTMLLEETRVHPEWRVFSHEQICEDPVSHFRTLAGEVGLSWTPEAERRLAGQDRPGEKFALHRVAAEEADSWKRRLTPDDARVINEVAEWFAARSAALAAALGQPHSSYSRT